MIGADAHSSVARFAFPAGLPDVRSGPDGYFYLLTDESPGVPARLEP
jgi:hypothetical protein